MSWNVLDISQIKYSENCKRELQKIITVNSGLCLNKHFAPKF